LELSEQCPRPLGHDRVEDLADLSLMHDVMLFRPNRATKGGRLVVQSGVALPFDLGTPHCGPPQPGRFKTLEHQRLRGEEALALHQELRDLFGIVGSLYVVGRAAAQLGDLDTAQARFMESLAIDQAVGERTGLALSLDALADLEISRDNLVRAMRLAGASEVIKEGVGGQAPPHLTTLPDPRERARPLMSEQEIETAWEEGRRMSVEQAIAYARELA
jgi:hypothetical protein